MNPLTVQSSPPAASYRPSSSASTPSNSNSDSRAEFNSEERSAVSGQQLDSQERRELQELKKRDREVRAHELAHVAAGGRYVRSGAQFQYEKGPDGRLYAVGGEVDIDTSPIPGDPRATLLKAQTVIRAALAPAMPSAQDRRVAAEAAQMAQQARLEISMERNEAQDKAQLVDVFA